MSKVTHLNVVSVVTPAYNEEENLPVLYQQLTAVFEDIKTDWEWIVIDDHSSDGSYAVISGIAAKDKRVRGIRLARNSGSHVALTCGLRHAKGDCAVVMAADLQDPPETIPDLLAEWRKGTQIVWAARAQRRGEKASTLAFSHAYHWLLRNAAGLKNMPKTGTDFFLMDRQVVDAFCQFDERNISIFGLITWMGFEQKVISYEKQTRLHGASGWTLGKKVKLAVDSMVSFSNLPLRVMSVLGITTALAGFLYALLVIYNALAGTPVEGWASLIVVVLVIGGVQMLMLGVLGEYVWRALDESRNRPLYFIESSTDASDEQLADGPAPSP